MASRTRITRRQLGASALAVAAASAQQPAAEPVNEVERARESLRRSGAALRKFKVPQLLEPSFSFRA